DNKYSKYFEQVYYVLAQLSLAVNRPQDAIDFYHQSTQTEKTTRKQKAISFAGLGEAYYQIGDYVHAKKAYDSVGVYAKHAQENKDVQNSIFKTLVLNKLIMPLENIHVHDSLLTLSNMDEKEQLKVIKNYIRQLEKARQDSINLAQMATGPGEIISSGTGNWYFSNPTLINSGASEFRRKFGQRTLQDNWRLSSVTSSNFSNPGTIVHEDDEDLPANSQVDENGIPTIAALQAAIPKTKEEI